MSRQFFWDKQDSNLVEALLKSGEGTDILPHPKAISGLIPRFHLCYKFEP